MESIGEKLKLAREAKKFTIKEVVKATNISPLYLQALEDEDFDKFPSETYLIGFLRSYSEYLKLDAEEIIHAYRGYKIGESTTPIEELTKPTKSPMLSVPGNLSGSLKTAALIACAIVVAGGVFFTVKSFLSSDVEIAKSDSVESIKEEYKAKKKDVGIENIRSLQLSNDKGYVLVYKNEAVQFMVGTKEVIFLLSELSNVKGKEEITVTYLPDRATQAFALDKNTPIEIKDVPRKVFFTLKGLTENRAKLKVVVGNETEASVKAKEEAKISDKVADTTQVVAQSKESLKIVFLAEFTQKSFVELYLDGQLKKRGFVPKGSIERWEATEYVQIKIGNAGGLKAQINGRKYVFGKPGQIANKVVTWKKDVKNPNLYNIVIKDW